MKVPQFESKLSSPDRLAVEPGHARALAEAMFVAVGCERDVAREVAAHLVEADQCGVASHGIVRVLQYVREFRDGTLSPRAQPGVTRHSATRLQVEAGGGIGIPAMRVTHEAVAAAARAEGMAVAALYGAGHTGRLGAFAEAAARQGCLTIALGGGNRDRWRMVAPHGGRKALLPTNPYCIAIPGGARGPVVIDFATSMIAGGWIYAARAAGTELPDGAVIDRDGHPTRDPEDYFGGGAILPKGGPMGYGLAVMAELVGEAMLGPVERGEINWLVLAIDSSAFRQGDAMQSAAEEILAELRACPPAAGHARVHVPGERERDRAAAMRDQPLRVPAPIWTKIEALAGELGVVAPARGSCPGK